VLLPGRCPNHLPAGSPGKFKISNPLYFDKITDSHVAIRDDLSKAVETAMHFSKQGDVMENFSVLQTRTRWTGRGGGGGINLLVD
jgi:hypothetical protein